MECSVVPSSELGQRKSLPVLPSLTHHNQQQVDAYADENWTIATMFVRMGLFFGAFRDRGTCRTLCQKL